VNEFVKMALARHTLLNSDERQDCADQILTAFAPISERAKELEAALQSAQSELIFWQEHNRESPNAMIGPGQSILRTLAIVRSALRPPSGKEGR
jgi:hypothetical protein